MNIFIVDECPVLSAAALPDRHVTKMGLETCQMISVIYSPWYHNWGTIPKKDGTPYKTEKGAFRNRPCTQWAAESYENLAWLILHGYALCNEYWHRYGKVHSCFNSLQAAEVIFLDNSQESLEIYKNVKSFVRAMPDNFKLDNTISDIEAYQRYVASKPWAQHNYLRIPNRKPLWMINYAG